MKGIELSQLCTGVPTVRWDASVEEVLKVFEDNPIYDMLVSVKDGKPLGVIYRNEAKLARYKPSVIAVDISHLVSKVKNVNVDLQGLLTLLSLFTSGKKPVMVVDRKGNYMGIIFHDVLLHYLSMHQEARISVLQRLRSLLGQKVYLYVFTLDRTKDFRDRHGLEKERGLFKILYEDVKESIEGDAYFSEEDRSVYVISKKLLDKKSIKGLMEEFHREYSLLYAESSPVFVHGMLLNLERIKTLEEVFERVRRVEDRLSSIKDVSFFMYHDEPQSIVVCEYRTKELIPHIKEKLLKDFMSVVDTLTKADKDTWEYVLYDLFKSHPYFELFYIMNERGIQISNNITNPKVDYRIKTGRKGADRSDKPYFKQAMEHGVYMSDIYISQATDDFCITISSRFNYGSKTYVLAGDINYREIHTLLKRMAGGEG